MDDASDGLGSAVAVGRASDVVLHMARGVEGVTLTRHCMEAAGSELEPTGISPGRLITVGK